MLNELDGIVAKIPNVNTDRQYWFVRTDGGYYYKEFLSSNVISIGFEKISINDIFRILNDDKKDPKKALITTIKEKYPDNERPGLAASQIIRFFTEIKNGDVVIIPSESSSELSFGIIQDDKPFQHSFFKAEQNKDFSYDKARSVFWVKTVGRKALNPKLFSLFFAHQTISNGNEYSQYIDSTINDFYKKDGKVYLQLKVLKKEDINARQLFSGCLELLDITDEFLTFNNYHEDTSGIDVKISLNSPGEIEFIGVNFYALTIVGMIIIAVVGGGFRAKHGETTVELKSDGLIKRISDFLKERHRETELSSALEKLEASDPKDLVQIIKKMIK